VIDPSSTKKKAIDYYRSITKAGSGYSIACRDPEVELQVPIEVRHDVAQWRFDVRRDVRSHQAHRVAGDSQALQ